MLTLEFTIEPFVEGHPGPHVMSAVAAVEALGVEVEFGPFGSACSVDEARIGEVAAAIFGAAFAHGASHVTMFAARDRGRDPDVTGGPADQPGAEPT